MQKASKREDILHKTLKGHSVYSASFVEPYVTGV